MALTEKECSELLPWYVNGTLSADEMKSVEALLGNSESLRDEVKKIKRLKESLPMPDSHSGSDLGWRRLQKQIHSERSQVKFKNWKSYIAIAAVLMITVQVGLFALMQQSVQPTTNVRLLGGQEVVVQNDQLLLQVQIAPEASWQQVTDIFSTLNASIVQGPSALGLIYVQVDLQDLILDGEPATQAQQVLDWLNMQSLIAHVVIERASAETGE